MVAYWQQINDVRSSSMCENCFNLAEANYIYAVNALHLWSERSPNYRTSPIKTL